MEMVRIMGIIPPLREPLSPQGKRIKRQKSYPQIAQMDAD